MRTRSCFAALFLPITLAACQTPDARPIEVDNRAPVVAEVAPPAISGGTLLATGDGLVVASDPDRDRVYVVSISPARFEADVLFEPGAEPGRVVEGSEGLVHVVLRGAGDIVAIDTTTGDKISRRHVCTDPRGLAFDDASASLFVACADGNLVTLPEDAGAGEAQRSFIEPDLRDVIVADDHLLISRMRSAEVLSVSKSATPQVLSRRTMPAAGTAIPTVAWRMIELESGQVGVLHQFSETAPVSVTAPGDSGDDDDDRGDDGGDAPYGGGGGGFCSPGIVTPGVSVWSGSDAATATRLIAPTPAVDIARSPFTGSFAVAIAGAPDGEPDVRFASEEGDGCFDMPAISTPGQPVAVAYLDDGRLVVQSREPSALYIYSDTLEHELTFELAPKSRFDTGHDLFHRATDAGIACASCHPEGTDDGHVWQFETIGRRRTQSPEVGLEGSAPFHWDGDMDDFSTLSNEVYTHRMGGPMQSDARGAAFERWLMSAKREPAGTEVDETLRASGAELFVDYGCASCHSGARFSNDKTVDIQGKRLQVPSLRRVAVRPPYMHDGRATDLRGAVLDMLDSTQSNPYSGEDVDAIVVYLQTL